MNPLRLLMPFFSIILCQIAEGAEIEPRILVRNISERIMRLELNPQLGFQALIKQYWGDISLLDLRTGRKIWNYHQNDMSFSDFGLSWSHNNVAVAIGGSQPALLNARDGTLLQKLQHPNQNFVVTAIAFSEDDRLIAGSSYGDETAVYLWDAQNGKIVATLSGPQVNREHAYDGAVRLQFSRNGKTLFGAGGQWFAVWNVETHKLIQNVDLHDLLHISSSYAIDGGSFAFTRDLRYVAFNHQKNISIVSLENLKIVRTLTFPSYPRLYEFTDNNEYLVVAGLGTNDFEPPQPVEPYRFQFGKINVLTGELFPALSTQMFDFLPNEHTAATSGLRVAGFDLRSGFFVLAAGRNPIFRNGGLDKFATNEIMAWHFEN